MRYAALSDARKTEPEIPTSPGHRTSPRNVERPPLAEDLLRGRLSATRPFVISRSHSTDTDFPGSTGRSGRHPRCRLCS